MARIIVIAILMWVGVGAGSAQSQSRFDGWASAIVAADWRTSAGDPIAAFDNARRDLVAGFLAAGFARRDMVDYTLRPDVREVVSPMQAVEGIQAAAARATRGCFLYITSHGSPAGINFGPDQIVSPTAMATFVRETCGTRPTVVVISACFSGVFLGGLSAPNRMVVTAARPDRASFGCAEDADYPYFDGCMIQSLPAAADFIALAHAAQTCIRERETAENLAPASEPQVVIGADMQLLLPTLRFSKPPG